MASFNSKTQYDNYTLWLNVWEDSYNVSNNTSLVKWNLYIINGGRRFSISSFNYYVKINDVEVANYTGSCNTTDVAVSGGEHFLASGELSVPHNSDGTKSIYCYTSCNGRSNGNGPGWGSADGTLGLTTIPRQANITRCDNFNSNGSPYMEFTNPGGFKLNLRLEFGGTSISRNSYYGSGGYTFQLTESERNLLYSKCSNGNSLTVRYVVATCIGGGNETHWSYIDRTMTVVNSNPEFNYFEFEDVSEKTTLLTGNPKSIIKGYSEVLISIPVANKATAKNYATMSKYRGKIGELTVDIPYSEDAIVGGRIKNAPSSTITCYAIDSRNNSTAVEKQAENFINYIPVTKGNITVSRNNGVSEEVKLKIDGNYNAINFGRVINSIKTSKYRFKTKENTEWSDYENFEISTGATGENGSFSFDGFIKGDTETFGFNISNSYMFEVLIEDELSSVTFTANLGSGIPNVALAKQGVGIMGKYDEEVGGLFQVGGKCYDKNIMTIFSTSRFDISGTEKRLTKLTSEISVGDKLTLSNSSIKIGKGVKKVLVSATISWWMSTKYYQTRIEIRNQSNKILARAWYETREDQYTTDSMHVTPFLTEVNEGDEISLWFGNGSDLSVNILGDARSTFLTVEVVE